MHSITWGPDVRAVLVGMLREGDHGQPPGSRIVLAQLTSVRRRKGSPFPVRAAAHHDAVQGGEVKREAGISPQTCRSAPGRTRTCDPLLRRQPLCPD
jgi:hypothetical protein